MGDRGIGFFQLRGEPVEITFGDRLAADQLAATPVLNFRQAQFSFSGAQQRLFNIAVQLQEQLASRDLLSGLELQGLDRPCNLQAQIDPLQGLEGANSRELTLPRLFVGGNDGNIDGRFGRGEYLDLPIDGKGFIAPEAQHHEQHNPQHDQHPATQHIPLPWKDR